MPRAQTSRTRVRLLLGSAAALVVSVVALSLLLSDGRDEPEIVEIATPRAPLDVGDGEDLLAVEGVEESARERSSTGAQREVVSEWAEFGELSLRGRVVGRASSEAVEGARVTVSFEGGEVQATSASSGEFELDVPAGVSLNAVAFAHGYNIGRRRNLNPEEELVFRLDGGTVIKGVILGPNVEAFEGAQVRLWADDDRSQTNFSVAPDLTLKMTGMEEGDPALTFHPDERGAFEVYGLEPGEFDFSVEVPGWSYGIVRDVVLRKGETRHVEFELVRAGSAQARIVYEGTLVGVADCQVEVTPWIQGLTSDVENAAKKIYESDKDGWVELSWLNPGESRVRIRALNGLFEEITERLIVTADKREILTWELPGLHPLSGVIRTESGETVTKGWVHLFSGSDSEDVYFGDGFVRDSDDLGLPRSVEIAADGSYRFESVPAETTLTLSAVSDAEPLAVGYSRVILAGSRASNRYGGRSVKRLPVDAAVHDFELEAALRLEGFVQGPDGEGQAGAEIHLYNVKRGPMGLDASQVQALLVGSIYSEVESRGTLVATSDEEGRFVVEGLLPSDGWVSAELDGYKKEWERIDVQEQPTELLIELQVAPSLRGRVVDLDGDPIPWARVNASRSGGSRRNRERWCKADEYGRFEFKMGNGRGDSGFLDEGEWTFVARASSREPVDRPKRVVPGAEELVLRMGPAHVADAASLRGKVLLPDGMEPSRLRLQRIRSAALSVDGGDFKITGLNPGAHKLVFEARGCAPKSLGEGEKNELLLSEGEERDLGLITMYPGREVAILVENSEGRMEKAQVRFTPVSGYASESGSGTRKPGYERRGTYYMGSLELGTWSLVVKAAGYEKVVKEVVLGADSAREIKVKMKERS